MQGALRRRFVLTQKEKEERRESASGVGCWIYNGTTEAVVVQYNWVSLALATRVKDILRDSEGRPNKTNVSSLRKRMEMMTLVW